MKRGLCLKVCSLAAVILMVVTLEICRKPFGPKMCRDLCERTAGCTSYVYSASSLSCYIGYVHSGDKQKCVPYESQVIVLPGNPQPCPGNSKVIESRTRGLQCVKAGRQEKRITPLRRKKKLTRILLYARYSTRVANLQIFIDKKRMINMKGFPNPPCCSNVFAVVYIQSITRILVSTKDGIMTTPLDSPRYTTLNSSLKLLDMALDGDEGLIFMLRKAINKHIALITMSTTNFTYIQESTLTGSAARFLAIDAKRNVCFVTTRTSIISVTYDGHNEKVLYKGKMITTATMNPLLNVLYFIQNKHVMTLSLPDNKVTMPKILTGRDLVYIDNALYIMKVKRIEKIVGNKTVVICSGKRLAAYRMIVIKP